MLAFGRTEEAEKEADVARETFLAVGAKTRPGEQGSCSPPQAATAAEPPRPSFTPREREVLTCLQRG